MLVEDIKEKLQKIKEDVRDFGDMHHAIINEMLVYFNYFKIEKGYIYFFIDKSKLVALIQASKINYISY